MWRASPDSTGASYGLMAEVDVTRLPMDSPQTPLIQIWKGGFSCSVNQPCPTLCNPRGLQHARLPYPSLSPRACSNSCPLSQWCHPTISSSAVPFSLCLQSFPASGSFPVSRFLVSGGQSIGASASASVLPVNIQGWFPLRLTRLGEGIKLWGQHILPALQEGALKLS